MVLEGRQAEAQARLKTALADAEAALDRIHAAARAFAAAQDDATDRAQMGEDAAGFREALDNFERWAAIPSRHPLPDHLRALHLSVPSLPLRSARVGFTNAPGFDPSLVGKTGFAFIDPDGLWATLLVGDLVRLPAVAITYTDRPPRHSPQPRVRRHP